MMVPGLEQAAVELATAYQVVTAVQQHKVKKYQYWLQQKQGSAD